MKYLLGTILISLAGAVVVVNGVSLDVADIFSTTKQVASQANLHQVRTALEVYWLDNGCYPNVDTSEDLISALYHEGYIEDKTASFTNFSYKSLQDGQDYDLEIKG